MTQVNLDNLRKEARKKFSESSRAEKERMFRTAGDLLKVVKIETAAQSPLEPSFSCYPLVER